MERAALACTQWIVEHFRTSQTICLVCGTGNNGADGLAIARLLSERHYNVEVFVIKYSPKESEEFTANRKKLSQGILYHEIHNISEIQIFFKSDKKKIIIDALFGSGLNRASETLSAEVIKFLNSSKIPIISVDVPSGLFCDELNDSKNSIINAQHTLSFQFPKLSFMFPENADHVGSLTVLDIALHQKYINSASTQYHYLTGDDVSPLLKRRSLSSHKGTFGHALLIAGSYGRMGAAILAGKAALRTGTGLLTLHIPECGYEIIQSTIPEAMATVDSGRYFWFDNIRLEKFNAIAVGPGISTDKQTQNALKLLVQNTGIPLVLDADALNIISENKTWLAFLPANSILTPHPKEFERLTQQASSGMERLKIQREFSIKNKVYVILKGVHTSVSCPDGTIYFNSTGNPGMAKGGSGDALTGIIVSLYAQGYNSKEACLLAVYLHGLAGDIALNELSEEGMLPSDVINKIPAAFNYLKSFTSAH